MAPRQNEKILVVDDDPGVVEMITHQVLAPMGYQVSAALDGATALQMALRTPPDILITSLELPGLSGRDLLAALRSQGVTSILIATGPRTDSHALLAFRLGARDYLAKPVRETELVASLDRALAEVRLRGDRAQLAEKLAAASQQLEKRVRELTTLASIGKAVTAVTNLGQLFARLLEGGMFVTEAEVGWLLLSDESTGLPTLRAAKNLPNLSTIRLNQPWDDGITSLLIVSGEGITLSGSALAKLRAGQVVKSAAAVPLKARDKVLGVLAVGNRSGQAFGERDLAMLSAVADYAVVAMVNARLFQALEARAAALQKAYEEQLALSRQKDQALQRVGQQLRAPLQQVRASLEHLAGGHRGALNLQQADAVLATLDRLAYLQRQLDDLAPAATQPLTAPSATPRA